MTDLINVLLDLAISSRDGASFLTTKQKKIYKNFGALQHSQFWPKDECILLIVRKIDSRQR